MAADGRSRLVRLLKLALPVAAVGLAAAVFLIQRDGGGGGLSMSGLDFTEDGGLRLNNPQFSGRTPNGQPFSVTAEWALPDGPDPERVQLGPLTGEIRLSPERTAFLSAEGGEARPKEQTLRLSGDVALRSDDGYSLTVAAADLDARNRRMTAEGPVRGAAPFGDLESGSMRAAQVGETNYMWFEDRVRVRIDPARAPKRGE
jgi:lipopolysaccharide export system protein LptC